MELWRTWRQLIGIIRCNAMLQKREVWTELLAFFFFFWLPKISGHPFLRLWDFSFFFQITSLIALLHRITLTISEMLNYCIHYFYTVRHISWSSLCKLSRYYSTSSLNQFMLRLKGFSKIYAAIKNLSVLGNCLDERCSLCLVFAVRMQIVCCSYITLSCMYFIKWLLVIR